MSLNDDTLFSVDDLLKEAWEPIQVETSPTEGFPDGRGSVDDPITVDPITVTVDGDEPVEETTDSGSDTSGGGGSGSGSGGTDDTSSPPDSGDDANTDGGGGVLAGVSIMDVLLVLVAGGATWWLTREL